MGKPGDAWSLQRGWFGFNDLFQRPYTIRN
jgi:hypothetical protein